MVKLFIGGLVCLLFINCASTVIKIMPEYSSMNVSKAKLGIIFIKEKTRITNPKDVTDDLGGGDPITTFSSFFSDQLLINAKNDSKFGNVCLVNNYLYSNFRDVNESFSGDEMIYLRGPVKNAFNSDSLPFLLILENISISRNQTSGGTMMGANGAMMGTGGSDDLILTGTFALWDNVSGKIVSMGKINEKSGVFIAMTKNTWANIVKSISYNIFIDKPYGKAYGTSYSNN
jgi:hypothetical protein